MGKKQLNWVHASGREHVSVTCEAVCLATHAWLAASMSRSQSRSLARSLVLSSFPRIFKQKGDCSQFSAKYICIKKCICNWPLPIEAFQDQCKQTMIDEYSYKHNQVKNPNWREADQLAIYKRSREGWTRAFREQHQLAVRTGFQPAAYGFQIRRCNLWAMLSPQNKTGRLATVRKSQCRCCEGVLSKNTTHWSV